MNFLIHQALTTFERILSKKEPSNALKLLVNFQLNRRRMHFQFQGDSTQYSCTVEAVDRNHRLLVIGNVFPSSPTINQFQRRKLLLAATDAGSEVRMASRYLQPLIGESNDLLMLQLPSKLHRPQEQEVPYFLPERAQRAQNNTVSTMSTRSSESQAA